MSYVDVSDNIAFVFIESLVVQNTYTTIQQYIQHEEKNSENTKNKLMRFSLCPIKYESFLVSI